MARYVIGIDGGTEGVRAGVFSTADGRELGYASASYATSFPRPGWAEQAPADWWAATGVAVRGALAAAEAAGVATSLIAGVACDTTCCTVCALDANHEPLRPALLWMDMRSAAKAEQVASCSGDSALLVNGGGGGAVSAEWMVPKALWLKQEEPQTWARTAHICEYQDWLNWQLTGCFVASCCNAAVRWHWQGGVTPPASLLARLSLTDLLSKWPQTALPPGAVVGGLTPEAAAHLGLPPNLPVIQGGADAFIGMIGLDVLRGGEVALLTGSSHLHLGVSTLPLHGAGVWGSYAGALPGQAHVVEGGQTSTGSVAAWFRRTLALGVSYAELDAEAAGVPIGSGGLVLQEHFQGNRTPHTDAASRGVWCGLTLAHTRGHLWRSILEGVAFGTRLTLAAMAERGMVLKELAVAGGAARSDLWLQMHADVTGLPLRITACGEAPALGCAVLAAAAVGAHLSVEAAAAAMVRADRVIMPSAEAHTAYEPFYEVYKALYHASKECVRGAAAAASSDAADSADS